MTGIPIDKLIAILRAIKHYAPKATVDTDDTEYGLIRVNYNGPRILEPMSSADAEVLDKVALMNYHADISVSQFDKEPIT